MPAAFFSELAWVKKPEDYPKVVDLLKNVENQLWSLQRFSEALSLFKSMKFLRIQIRTEVNSFPYSVVNFFFSCLIQKKSC